MKTTNKLNTRDAPQGSLLYLSFCCFASAFGGLLFGYDLFVIAGAKDLIVQHFRLSTLMEGWFVSSAMVGAMLGCLAAGTVSDHYGRKKVLIVEDEPGMAEILRLNLQLSNYDVTIVQGADHAGLGRPV